MSLVDDLQFKRVIEVDIKNFKTNEKITIGNDFKIEFTFYKTIDEVNEASVGNVKIYGLTEETRKSLGGSGNELTLRCGYANSEVKTLFIADVVRVSPEYSASESIVSIDVSANFMDYAFTKTANFDEKEVTIYDRAVSLGLAEDSMVIWDLSNINKEDIGAVQEWLKNRISRVTYKYNQKQDLDNFCDTFGFTFRRGFFTPNENTNDIYQLQAGQTYKTISFYIPANKVHIITQWAYGSYPTVVKKVSAQDKLDEKNFKALFITDDEQSKKEAFVLSKETGMLGFPRLQDKIVQVPESWKVRKNEEVDQESLNTINEKKKQIADKQQKRLADGKKALKVKPKNYTIKVNRRYVSVTAQINPSINPQSHVKIISLIEEANGIYRVRNIKYDACNREGNFNMVLDCEDSSGNKDFELTREQIEQEQNQTLDIDSSGTTTNTDNLGSDNLIISEGS
jgi:hypothetical protein